MPVLLRPDVNARMPVWLDSDKDLPIGKRPVFYFRAVSYDESTGRMQELWDAFRLSPPSDKAAEKAAMKAFLAEYMTGWANMIHPKTGEPIPFSIDEAMQWLTPAELLEIGRESFYLTAPNVEEKKS